MKSRTRPRLSVQTAIDADNNAKWVPPEIVGGICSGRHNLPLGPHQALGNRTPMAVWRDGTSGRFIDTAVDMTLRLDNAGALPTYPQPQQQQQQTALFAA